MRACVEMAKAWRMDKYLRRLEAVMIVCDPTVSLTLTGTGDVIDAPEDGVIGIGSGGSYVPSLASLSYPRDLSTASSRTPHRYATAAARALVGVDGMSAEAIGRKAMDIASDMCVYTNKNYVTELLDASAASKPVDAETVSD